jgi:hypothetical protein
MFFLIYMYIGLERKTYLDSDIWNVTTTGSPQLYVLFPLAYFMALKVVVLKFVLLNMVQNRINIKYLQDSNARIITRSSSVWNMAHNEFILL